MPAHAAGRPPRHHKPTASPAQHRAPRSRGHRPRLTPAVAVACLLALTGALVAHVGPGGAAGDSQTLKFAAAADTYVMYGAPRQTRGDSLRLTAGSRPGDRKVIYLRFRIDARADTVVSDARLTLIRDEHHLGAVVELYAVKDTAWDERTLNATSAPATGSLIGSVVTNWAMNTVSFDVSRVVRAPGVYSFAVASPTTDDVARFRSREYGAAGPVLEATLTTGTPDPLPTPPVPSTSTSPVPTVGPISPTPTPTPTNTTTSAPAPSPTTTAPVPPGTLPRPTCSVSAILVPSCGRWWGIAPAAFTPQHGATGLHTDESLAQRPFDIFHSYHVNDQLFPTTAEVGIATEAGRNRLLYLNWKPATDMTWRQVANGAADARIDRLAAHIKSTFPYKFFLTIWHEPENDVNATAGSGKTAADYAAMFRHTVLRLRADGVRNAVVVMNYMSYSRWNNTSWFGQLYPGDDVVDWIAWDPYASGQESGWLSGDFAKLVNRTDGLPFPGFYTWATTAHPDKPIMLAEWGVFEDLSNPTGKAQFFESVAEQIARYPKFKALLYFDVKVDPHGNGDTSLDSSKISLDAFRVLSRNPNFIAPQPVLTK
jgi:hypothetical protein